MTRVPVEVDRPVAIEVRVYDVLGRGALDVVRYRLAPGRSEIEIEGSELPAGTYFYQIRAVDSHGVAERGMMVRAR